MLPFDVIVSLNLKIFSSVILYNGKNLKTLLYCIIFKFLIKKKDFTNTFKNS